MESIDKFEDYFRKIIEEERSEYLSKLNPNKYSEEEGLRVLDILKRDCSQFLDEIKYCDGEFLFRGVQGGWREITSGLYLKQTRQDRLPKDSTQEFSEIFDSEFYENFGVKIRSGGVTTTKDVLVAKSYTSNVFIFFPIDGYQYFWNPRVFDLWKRVREEDWYWDDHEKNIDNYRLKIRELVDGYVEGGLERVTFQEVNFVCREYYLVDPNLLDFLTKNI